MRKYFYLVPLIFVLFQAATLKNPLLHTDEIATLLAVNSRSTSQVYDKFHEASSQNAYQEIYAWMAKNPDSSLKSVWQRHIQEEPQFSPLFSLSAFLWTRVVFFLDPVLALRLFSLLGGVVAWGAFLHLFRRLKIMPTPVLMTALLCTPSLWLLAREARFYSWWLALMLMSWALFLDFRENSTSKKTFALWILCQVAALNLQVLQLAVFVSQALFLFLENKKTYQKLLIAGICVGLSYLPWALIALHSQKTFSNMPHLFSENPNVILGFLRTASRVFWDFDIGRKSPALLKQLFVLLSAGMGALVLFLASKKAQDEDFSPSLGFLFSMPVLMLLLSDLFLKTSFANLQRYLTPFVVSIVIFAVWAYWESPQKKQASLFVGLWIFGGAYSLFKISFDKAWRTHPYSFENIEYVEMYQENLPDGVFKISELYNHLKETQPSHSDFIRALVILGRIETFRELLPLEKRPVLKW